jgi:alkyl hydroperoxide reductase subunit AhpC
MKTFALALAAALTVAAFTHTAVALELGDKPPKTDVKMKGVDGKDYTIADVKGEKGTLVIFSCNHCPFVIAWEERIAAIGNEYMKKGVGVIQINPNDYNRYKADAPEMMAQRAKERGFQFPYVVDETSEVARAFKATVTPEFFLFGADDKLVFHGALDDNHRNAAAVTQHYLRNALEALLKGEAITVNRTKTPGCTIKWRQ